MNFDQLPQAEVQFSIDFVSTKSIEQDRIKLLFSSGEAPCTGIDVSLSPLIDIETPDYWRTKGVGSPDRGSARTCSIRCGLE